jgi:hypothetical protein
VGGGERGESFGGARRGSHPELIAAGLIVGGGMHFPGMLIFNRGVLETEPGDADLFAMSSGVAE